MSTTPVRLVWAAIVVAAPIVFIRCSDRPSSPPMRAGIVAALDSSAAGWTDLDMNRFMAIYLDDNRTTYAAKTEYLHGLTAIRAHYAPNFGSGVPRTVLKLEQVEVDSLGPSVANVRAFYVLSSHDSVVARGPTSLIMELVGGHWLIVHDHSS